MAVLVGVFARTKFRITSKLPQSAAFSAWPISDFWNLQGKMNLDFGVWATTMAALDVLFDLLVLCLPLPVIAHLQITTKRKISLIGMFWLGLL